MSDITLDFQKAYLKCMEWNLLNKPGYINKHTQ